MLQNYGATGCEIGKIAHAASNGNCIPVLQAFAEFANFFKSNPAADALANRTVDEKVAYAPSAHW